MREPRQQPIRFPTPFPHACQRVNVKPWKRAAATIFGLWPYPSSSSFKPSSSLSLVNWSRSDAGNESLFQTCVARPGDSFSLTSISIPLRLDDNCLATTCGAIRRTLSSQSRTNAQATAATQSKSSDPEMRCICTHDPDHFFLQLRSAASRNSPPHISALNQRRRLIAHATAPSITSRPKSGKLPRLPGEAVAGQACCQTASMDLRSASYFRHLVHLKRTEMCISFSNRNQHPRESHPLLDASPRTICNCLLFSIHQSCRSGTLTPALITPLPGCTVEQPNQPPQGMIRPLDG